MAQPPNEDKLRQRKVVGDRVKFLLDYHWGGNQRQMARDLGVSQGLISKIVNGLQGAGRRFLASMARQPGVSAAWVLRGEGQPLSAQPEGTLSIASALLPGPPQKYSHLLTGERHPVAKVLDRPSRYWLALPYNSPLLGDGALQLRAADLLLLETDPAWTGRLDLIEGRLCGIRYQNGLAEPAFALGKVYRDTLGMIFDALVCTLRLATKPSRPLFSTTPETPEPKTKSFSKIRRKVTTLDQQEKRAEKRRQVQEQQRQEALLHPQEIAGASKRQEEGTFTLQDVIAVCVYLVRPAPGFVHKETTAATTLPG